MLRRFRLPFLALAAAFAAGPGAAPRATWTRRSSRSTTRPTRPTSTRSSAERDGVQYLTTALAVYPFEEPGIGPNKYNFDDDVRYEIHVATGDDLAKGKADAHLPSSSSTTRFKNDEHDPAVLPRRGAERGRRQPEPDADLHRAGRSTAAAGAARASSAPASCRRTTRASRRRSTTRATTARTRRRTASRRRRRSTATPRSRSRRSRTATASFAGQRDDGFYADIQSIFDLLQLRSGADSLRQPGRLQRPHDRARDPALGARRRPAGGRRLRDDEPAARDGAPHDDGNDDAGRLRPGRPPGQPAVLRGARRDRGQGPLQPHDARRRTRRLFAKYAREPGARGADQRDRLRRHEGRDRDRPHRPARDLHPRPHQGRPLDRAGAPRGRRRRTTRRTRTTPASRGSAIFGGDVLTSTRAGRAFGNGTVPGGWPNGRRFGDDVVDIAVSAILSDLRDPANPVIERRRRHRQRERQRHRLQQGVPVRRDAAERPAPRAPLGGGGCSAARVSASRSHWRWCSRSAGHGRTIPGLSDLSVVLDADHVEASWWIDQADLAGTEPQAAGALLLEVGGAAAALADGGRAFDVGRPPPPHVRVEAQRLRRAAPRRAAPRSAPARPPRAGPHRRRRRHPPRGDAELPHPRDPPLRRGQTPS